MTESSVKDNKAVRAVRWLSDPTRLQTFLQIAGGILMGFFGEFLSANNAPSYYTPLFWVGVAMLSVGGVWALWLSPTLSSLQDQLQLARTRLNDIETDYYEHFNYHLQLLAEELEFSGKERVSVYRPGKNGFLLLGRYCSNPSYAGARRRLYESKAGCIAKAWTDGWYYRKDLPDPRQNLNLYVEVQHNDFDIPTVVSRAWTMKSRCYYAVRVNGHGAGKPGAVLVLESTSPRGIRRPAVDPVLNRRELKRLGEFLDRMRGMEPALDIAKEMGF